MTDYRDWDKDALIRRIRELEAANTKIEFLELLERVVAFSCEGVAVTNMHGKMVYMNPACEELFGYTTEQMRKLLTREVFTEAGMRVHDEELLPALKAGKSWRGDIEIARPDGSFLPIHGHLDAIHDYERDITYTFGFYHDISERKRFEQELEQANAGLRSALQAKSEFMSMMSHELRSPLAPVIAYSELLLEGRMGELPPRARNALSVILRRAGDLGKLIEDLLQLTRLDRNAVEIQSRRLPVLELLSDLASDYEKAAHGKPVRIVVECGEQEAEVFGDPSRLRQVFRNLFDNSVKYGGDRVEIRIGVQGDGDRTVIQVGDNGAGIPPECRDRIFERFYQADQSETSAHGGSGLGLAIVRELIELMDGEVGLEPEGGPGAVFRLELPARCRRAAGQPAPTKSRGLDRAPTRAGVRILVVDDDGEMLEVLEELLSERYRVITARDGEACLEIVERTRVDLIMLDWMMPRMDGLAVIKRLKQSEEWRRIPVVFLTGRADDESRQAALECGAAEFLAKPCERLRLFQCIESALN